MTVKTNILAALAVTTAVGVGVVGTNVANAASSGDSLAEKIAASFNLDQSEVEKVISEHREEKEAEREERMEENLQSKVDDGTITAEQKTIIEDARDELKSKLDELRDGKDIRELSSQERDALHEQMKDLYDEMKAKLSDAGINLEDIMPHRGEMRRGHHGPHDDFMGESEE